MTEPLAEQRARVCAVARTFIGTPYHHNGCLKGVGVDCATLLVLVYREAGFTITDPPPYPPQFFMHRDRERYLEEIDRYCRRVDAPAPGDIVVYRLGRTYAHGAIILEGGWPAIVHANARARAVIEDRGDGGRIGVAPRRFYSPW